MQTAVVRFAGARCSGAVGRPRDAVHVSSSSKTSGNERNAVAPLSRVGERWNTAEYAQLVEEVRARLTVSQIATAHERPSGGIAAACNRLLPTGQRPSSHQHAPAALHRCLQEHPDGTLAIPPATMTRRKKRSEEEFTPLPERTAEGLAADAQFEPGDAAALTSEAIAGLEGKPREQRILRMRVGFEEAPHTLAEIAKQLGVSSERIRQIQTRAFTLLVRQGRKAGTPGAALAARLHLPSPDALDEAFADRIATIVSAEFEAPSRVAIPILQCAAGVATPTARQVAILARVAEERRQKLESEQRRAATAAHQAATDVRRADAVVARWTKHASWPAALAPPPEREKLRALRLEGEGEAAGIFRSPKLGRTVLYESGLEFAALTILENSEVIAWYQEQPLKIPYTWEGRHRLLV